MIVMKFGGTSVGSAENMDKVLDIAAAHLERAPLLISSAMSKITDTFVDITALAEKGEKEQVSLKVEEIKTRHLSTAGEFLSGENLASCTEKLNYYFKEIQAFSTGLVLLKECSPRSIDIILSYGELLSTTLLYHRALERGINAEFIDSREFVITDESFTAALPVLPITYEKIRQGINPHRGTLLIGQGFIARTEKGAGSTLGRGGSDFTATIFGAALKAEEVQIWTDVDGIMTSDPRIVDSARTIDTISYAEAAELAYFGAKVVHPSTIQPAVELGIPVLVKNTMNVNGKYTAIVPSSKIKGLRAIAGKKNITVINISSSRMLNAYGFLHQIFAIFKQWKTSVDLIATSEVSVSMTIDSPSALPQIVQELEKIGKVSIEREKGIICLVGQAFWSDSTFISRVFKSLSDVPIRMISLGSSDINLSLVIPEKMLHTSIRRLHNEFFD